MYISFQLTGGTLGTSVNGTANVSRGFGALTTPLSASLSGTGLTYQPNAGVAGVVIGGDTTITPQLGIERIRIWGRATTSDSWTLLADINYAALPDAAAGTTLGDGLTDADGSYYISGGRLKRQTTGTGLKPRYLNTSTNWQWVEIIADDATTVPGTSGSNARCFGVVHYNVAGAKFLYGGFRFRTTSPSTITRECVAGYCDTSTDPTSATATIGTAPGHGGWFGKTSFASVAGTTVSITAGKMGLGGYTPAWQWYYATVANGTGTAISGASGTGYPSDLSWSVPVGQQGVPLWIWCESVANGQTIYQSYGPSGTKVSYDSTVDNRVRTPVQVTVPVAPNDATLTALYNLIGFPGGVRACTIGGLGDSITNSGFTGMIAILNAISTAQGHGTVFTGINAGKGGSRVADWRHTTAVSGNGISILDGAKNNFDGLMAALPGTGLRLISIALGTNDSFADATWQSNAAGILSDIQDGTYGKPGCLMVCHTFPVKTAGTLTDVQEGQVQMRAYWLAQAGTQGGLAYAGTSKQFAYWSVNQSLMSDGTHPDSGAGYDAWGRFIAEGILTALATAYPGDLIAPTISSVAVASNGVGLTITASEPLLSGNTSGFTLKVNGVVRAVSGLSVAGSSITGTISSAVWDTDVVTLDYAPGNVQDLAANPLASFTGMAVTNGSTQNQVSTISISPTTATLTEGQTQQFTRSMTGNGNFSTAVTWSITSGYGSITSGGLFTAPDQTRHTQTITVRVTSVQDPTKYASATVTVPALTSFGTSRNRTLTRSREL